MSLVIRNPDIPDAIYGEFYDTTDQQLSDTNATKITINTTAKSSGITLSGNTLTVKYKGVYIISWRLQVEKTGAAGVGELITWIRHNGANLNYSATEVAIKNKDEATEESLTDILDMSANDTIEFYMKTPDATDAPGIFASTPTGTSEVPSIHVTIHRIDT